MTTHTRTEPLPGFAGSQAFWQSAAQQSETWMKGQAEVLAEFQTAVQKYMVHRQDDFAKAIEAGKRMSDCNDPAKAAAIQQAWFAGCVQGLVADWMALMDPVAHGSKRHRQAPKETPIAVSKARHETAA